MDSPQAPAPKVIKRYANRKLYDTVESRYVTLEEIGEMIKQGVEVQIMDNRSKGDLTSVTLAQIIFEEEKKRSRMPLGVLREIIRSGGETVSDFVKKELQQRVHSLREGAEASLKLLSPDTALDKSRELLGATQVTLQEWQRRVDERLHSAVDAMTRFPHIGRELQQIAGRLAELGKRIEDLKSSGGEGGQHTGQQGGQHGDQQNGEKS